MKTTSKFLIGFAAAALTYLSLMLFAGHQRFRYHGFSHSRFYGEEKQYDCRQDRHQPDGTYRQGEALPEDMNRNNK